MPDIMCKDADASVYNVGFAQPWLPTLGGSLYAMYLFGTAAPLDVLRDYSGNDRDLTRAGAPVESVGSSLIGAFPAGYFTPFTGDQVIAMSGGAGMSAFAVFKTTADAAAVIFTCSDGAVTQHMGLLTSANADVRAAARNGGAGSVIADVAEDAAYRGTGFLFGGAEYALPIANPATAAKMSAVRKTPAGAMTRVSTDLAFTPVGPARFGIGRFNPAAPSDNTFPDAIEIAALAFYAGLPSNDDILAIYAGMQAAVLEYGGIPV